MRASKSMIGPAWKRSSALPLGMFSVWGMSKQHDVAQFGGRTPMGGGRPDVACPDDRDFRAFHSWLREENSWSDWRRCNSSRPRPVMASTRMPPVSQLKESALHYRRRFPRWRRPDEQRGGLQGLRNAGVFGSLARGQAGGILPKFEEEAGHFDGLAVIGRSAQRHTGRQLERAKHQRIILQGIGQQVDLEKVVRASRAAVAGSSIGTRTARRARPATRNRRPRSAAGSLNSAAAAGAFEKARRVKQSGRFGRPGQH